MEDKIKVVTIKVTCKQTMNFIEQFSNKTGDNTPLYTINGVNFHVLYEEEKMIPLSKVKSIIRKYENDNLYYGRDGYYSDIDIAGKWIKKNL